MTRTAVYALMRAFLIPRNSGNIRDYERGKLAVIGLFLAPGAYQQAVGYVADWVGV